MNRRTMALYMTGAPAAMMLASCTQQQVSDTEKKVADLIQQVQAGVVAACVSAGKIVPTANSVLQVLIAIVGSTSVLNATAAMIAQAITDIVAVGCPAPTGAKTATTPKGVKVVFY